MNAYPPGRAKATRILAIEDDYSVRAGIVAFLADSGYETLEAESGDRGLAVFHQERPDAVVCDLRLPGMDGLDVLAVIAKTSPDTPIIMLSGANLVGDAVQALQHGAWDFLSKPITDMSMLENAVVRALERARLLRENREYQRRLETVNWKLTRSLQQLRQDEEAGRKIQLRLLPADDIQIGPYRFRRRQFPSMYLCGDFVDYFAIDEQHTGFYMTDVSGHDAASAFVTVMLKTLMTKYRDALWQEADQTILRPHAILDRLNRDLSRQELEKHCTMFFGVLDQRANKLRCASAGQYPYPVLIEGYELRPLSSRSRPIGLFDEAIYETREYSLPERFALVLVSDGVLELLPPDSGRTKLQNFLNHLPLEMDLDAMIKGLRLPDGELLPDDVTFLTITRENPHG